MIFDIQTRNITVNKTNACDHINVILWLQKTATLLLGYKKRCRDTDMKLFDHRPAGGAAQ